MNKSNNKIMIYDFCLFIKVNTHYSSQNIVIEQILKTNLNKKQPQQQTWSKTIIKHKKMAEIWWKPITNQDTHIKWYYPPFPEITIWGKMLSNNLCLHYLCSYSLLTSIVYWYLYNIFESISIFIHIPSSIV